MLRISLLLLLGQKISTGGLLLALWREAQFFSRKRAGRCAEGGQRGAEDGITMCGRRSGRDTYIEVEYGGEEVGRGEVRM